MRRIFWIVTLLSPLSVFAQGYPDVEAVRDALFAKDADAVIKHLPVSVQKAFNEMSLAERKDSGAALLVCKNLEREVGKLSQGEGNTLLVIEREDKNGHKLELVLQKRISDGNESVLRFGARRDQSEVDFVESIEVWMRYEEGEWRIYELTPGNTRDKLDFSDATFLKKIRHSQQDANEASAVGAMRTYNTAMVTYAATYPDVGFPTTLDALGPRDNGGEPSPHNSGLLDSVMSTAPYQKAGYQFTYRPDTSRSPIATYTIVAIPVGERREGQRSFFTDESCVIRYTEEDREPNMNDRPLQ